MSEANQPRESGDSYLKSLGDRDEQVRLRAAEMLGRIGADAGFAIRDLVWMVLEDESADVRSEAAQALGCIDRKGEAAFGLLWTLRGADLDLPFWAAYALGRIGPGHRSAVTSLTKALNDEGRDEEETLQVFEKFCYAAGVVLNRMSGAEVVSHILSSLKNDTQNGRLWVAYALGKLGCAAAPAIRTFLQRTTSTPWDVLATPALEVIGREAEDSVRALIELLRVPKPDGAIWVIDPFKGQDQIVPRWICAVLGRIGQQAVPLLMQALNDSDVCRLAVRVLGSIGPDSATAVPFLAQKLDGGCPWTCADAAKALRKIGPAAVPALIEALASPNPTVKQAVAEALGAIGAEARNAVPTLINRLADEAEEDCVRREAALSLGRIGSQAEKAVPALTVAMADIDPTVSEAAARALGMLCTEAAPAVPNLVEILRCGQPDMRAAAASALGNIGPQAHAAVSQLIRALQDEQRNVRLEAVEALGGIGPGASAAVPALLRAFRNRAADLGPRVAIVLGQIGTQPERTVPVLVNALAIDPEPAIREASAHALGEICPCASQAIPALIEALEDQNEAVCNEAARALSRMGREAVPHLIQELRQEHSVAAVSLTIAALVAIGPSARPELIGVLNDTDVNFRLRRVAAAQALWRIDRRAVEVLPALIEALQDTDRAVFVRAVLALSEIGSGAVEALHETVIGDDNRRLREAAVVALCEIGRHTKAAICALIAALADQSDTVRSMAVEAFGLIGA